MKIDTRESYLLLLSNSKATAAVYHNHIESEDEQV